MPVTALGFDLQAFLRGEGGDWAGRLGLRVEEGSLVMRAFLPGARRVLLLRSPGDEAAAELTPLAEGFFEAEVAEARIFPYRLQVQWDGHWRIQEDPYRFGPRLGDLDRHLFNEGTHERLYGKMGAHPCAHEGVQGVAFAVWAPNARRVSVVGDFNGWDGRRHPMHPSPSGVWELFLPELAPGARYKFEILGADNRLLPLKADPFAFQCESPPRSASIVHGPPAREWKDGAWMEARGRRPAHMAPMSIYEVHLGSWRRRADGGFLSYRELADLLVPYAADLGFTHLELLPVMEHPFYGSWGYQPLSLFAPTGRYGTPEDLQAFVETAHRAGLGVILDWVPAHFPDDGHGLGLFDGTHLFEHADPRQGRHPDWNTLVYNYGRSEVQAFLTSSALFWMDRYHADGLRLDAVASMLYVDYSRPDGAWIPNRNGGRENQEAVGFLRHLNEAVYRAEPAALTIAEESTAWPGVSHPVHHRGLGFGFKWNMGWMHDSLTHFGRHMIHRRHHHDELTFGMLYHPSENWVLPLSHDEVVHGKCSLLGRMPGHHWERYANLRLLLAYQHAHGGKKLLFMGGEFGQEREWDHGSALDWHLLQDGRHRGLQRLVRDLNRLHRGQPALHEGDCEPWGFRWIDCGDRTHSVLSILRQAEDPMDFVVAVLNFTARPHEGYRVGVPVLGRYEELLNTDSSHYGGRDIGNLGEVMAEALPMHGQPCSVALTLPPLGALFLRPVP